MVVDSQKLVNYSCHGEVVVPDIGDLDNYDAVVVVYPLGNCVQKFVRLVVVGGTYIAADDLPVAALGEDSG